MEISDISGVGPSTEESFNKNGINTIEELANSSIEEIAECGLSNSRAKDIKFKAKQNTITLQTGIEVQQEYDDKNRIESHISNLDEAIEGGFEEGSVVSVWGESGCHRKGTQILMYDGSLKNVEDIETGDRVMGPDSTPRNVKELVTGTSEMYEVDTKKGEPFYVNDSHILTLFRGNDKRAEANKPEEIDISVNKYQKLVDKDKKLYKLKRTGVDFEEQELPLDPYFLGVILGDGSLTQDVRITSADGEVGAVVREIADEWDMKCVTEKRDDNVNRHRIVQKERPYTKNPIYEEIKKLGLNVKSEDKFVPDIYKTSSTQQRRELLAGYIDADGSYDGSIYDTVSKSEELSDGIMYVARSLGLSCYKSEKIALYKDREESYYRLTISGDCSDIPSKLIRKQADERVINKDNQLTGFDLTKVADREEYYGIRVDADNRYLLGDFTITHNTGKSQLAQKMLVEGYEQTEKPAILIETERDRFRPKRIEALASKEDTVDNIHRVKAYSVDKQYSSYGKIIETFNEASVVVVDSLTARIRLSSEFDGRGTLSERSNELGAHLIKLEEVAERLECPVIFTNQAYKNPDSYGKNVLQYGGSKIKHSSTYFINMTEAKGELFQAEVQQHPSTGNTPVLIDIGEDDISGVNS